MFSEEDVKKALKLGESLAKYTEEYTKIMQGVIYEERMEILKTRNNYMRLRIIS
ncbi:hypothetical protein [Sulfolobus sp. S-194]|uniref:hypothetical protein n=1 Tax=Sulfolobus sp. S-194 TaxID=2512240 RepID=UPI0019CFBF6D|nr:hypothetical protein [Sulfolobus sp. S-194]